MNAEPELDELNCKFDAPMFVDFTNGGQVEHDVDKWFDNRNGDDDIEEPNDQVVEAKDDKEDQSFCFFENKTAPNLRVVPSWKPKLQALQQIVSSSAKEQSEPPSKKNRTEPTKEPTRATTKSSAPRRSDRLRENKAPARAPMKSRNPMPKVKAPILTIPSTPNMLRRTKNKAPKPTTHKTIEEQELETIAKLQNELKQKRKENESFMKKALSGANCNMPHRSVEDKLTQAHEFHFELDKRIKKPQNNPGEVHEKNFVDTLRQHPISPSFKNRKPTKQQPFSFQSNQSRKRKVMDEEISACDGYLSIAQQCYKFQNSTPPRFRSKISKDQNTSLPQANQDAKQTSKHTCPKTPNLATKDRKRALPDDCLSREQQEEKDLEEMRNYKFKAQPFDPKIVEKQGTYGLKPQNPKSLTEQQPFHFASEQRATANKDAQAEVEEKPAPFKANPVPELNQIKFKPELPHVSTKQLPFSFDKRDREILAKKEEKIQKILDEEKKAREFYAQPLPSFSPKELPTINSKPITEIEPFNLSADTRGALKAKLWKDSVAEELQEMRKKMAFKAHSSNVLYQAPFVPKKSDKPNTTFEEFSHNSERRAEERALYEMNKKEKDLQNEQLILQREAEREAEEQRDIEILRKQLVHKANPIRKYKQVIVAGSDKPLTQPASPAWNSREKVNLRA